MRCGGEILIHFHLIFLLFCRWSVPIPFGSGYLEVEVKSYFDIFFSSLFLGDPFFSGPSSILPASWDSHREMLKVILHIRESFFLVVVEGLGQKGRTSMI